MTQSLLGSGESPTDLATNIGRTVVKAGYTPQGMGEADSLLVARLRAALAPFDELRLALLFGSQARGTARAGSDVDLAVDAPSALLGEIGGRVSEAVNTEVDVVPLGEASIPLLRELIRSSTVVYEKTPGAGAMWRSRVLAQLEIDGPWYDRMRDAWIATVAERGLGNGQ
jgi:uncharacterized protein